MADPFRHAYRQLGEGEKQAMDAIKDMANSLYVYLDETLVGSREKALAITKLEECVMWAVKGVTA